MQTSLRPASVCDTTPLQRFESQSSSNGEEPSTPTAASIIAAAASAAIPVAATTALHNNNNNVKLDLPPPSYLLGNGNENDNGHAHGHGHGHDHGNGNSNSNGSIMATTKQRTHGAAQILRRIFFDLCMLSCVALPMLGLSLWVQPYKRGFFCNDNTLKHPQKESTISQWMLCLMCAALPIAMIVLVEFYRGQDKHRQGYSKHHHLSSYNSGYHLCHLTLPQWLLQCYNKIGIFLFGLGLEQLTTDIAKYTIGRLRPNFFAICQPLITSGGNCSDAINAERYIENFVCTAADMSAKVLKDMRLSFPSGHASFTSYAMLYVVIYLQRRMHWPRIKMLRHLLQLLLFIFAWYTSLSRISDYKHHWSDVLAGAGIGVTYAILMTSFMW